MRRRLEAGSDADLIDKVFQEHVFLREKPRGMSDEEYIKKNI
jgi:sarcosine oxidase delta subunit